MSTKSGMMIEHVKTNGQNETIFNNLNLKGGGKRSRSKENRKKQKQRSKTKKDENNKQDNQRRTEARNLYIQSLNETERKNLLIKDESSISKSRARRARAEGQITPNKGEYTSQR